MEVTEPRAEGKRRQQRNIRSKERGERWTEERTMGPEGRREKGDKRGGM